MKYSLFFIVVAILTSPLPSIAVAAPQSDASQQTPESPVPAEISAPAETPAEASSTADVPAAADSNAAPSPSAQPAAAETQPAAAETQPAAAETQPVAAETQPAAAETQPAAAETQPAAAETQPAAVETQPAAAENQPAAAMQAVPVQASPAESTAIDNTVKSEEGFVFNFSGASWKDVLEWFSEQADLSLQIDRFPAGTVNYVDPSRTYNAAESLDILNRLLLDRGYALVRRGRMLLLIDLEVENAANLISEVAELVTLDELDGRSRSDIVSCVFPLGSLTPDAARQEIAQLVGPWGRTIVLDSARQVKVTETVAKLLAIRQLLENARQADSTVVEIVLQHRGSDEMLEIARPLIGLDPGQNANDEIRLSVGLYGERIYATGLPGKVALLESILLKADKPLVTADPNTQADVAIPVFETHRVKTADSATVFDVLQTLLAGTPETRIAIDPKTNAIVAYARPETQSMIAATIAKLEGSGQDFKVITLRRLDPAQALLTINKFFGVTAENTGGPIVDGDPLTGRLWIRGKPDDIAMIEKLIGELEGEDVLGNMSDKVRVLPYTGQAAEDALRQVQSVWSTLGRKNDIRTIRTAGTPASSGSEMPERRVHPEKTPEGAGASQREMPFETNRSKEAAPALPIDSRTGVRRAAQPTVVAGGPDRSAGYQLVATPLQEEATVSDASTGNPEIRFDFQGSDIVIQFSPAGMIVASEDTEALDAFEALMGSFASSSNVQASLPTIFWLKYAKADTTAELIASILGGGDSSMASVTDSLGSSLGGLGGGMMGLLGMGGGGGGGDSESSAKSILTSSGSVSIVPDARLNALIVQANPIDLETIEIILRKLDIQESPEDVEVVAKPALIPVIYQDAKSVAEVVKSVFADRMKSASEANRGGGQPNPQEIIAALRGGGRGGSGGGGAKAQSEPAKIIVSVDERSNSLVVIATPQDFNEVRQLVIALDEGGMQSEERVEVVTLKGDIKADVVKQALESILGASVKTSSSSTTSDGKTNTGSPATNATTPSSDDIQRRIEMFRAMRGGGENGAGRGGGGARGGGNRAGGPAAAGGGGGQRGAGGGGGGRGR